MLSNYEVKLAWVELRRFLGNALCIQAVHNCCISRTQGELSVVSGKDLWCVLKLLWCNKGISIAFFGVGLWLLARGVSWLRVLWNAP